MFNELKKKLNNPNILCLVFFGASLIIMLERLISFGAIIHARPNASWSAFEYTLAFLLPLSGFAYFCASKYAQNRINKIRAFINTSSTIDPYDVFEAVGCDVENLELIRVGEGEKQFQKEKRP